MSDPRVGTVLCQKYRLERLLGQGGMGVVYAARNIRIDRPVAIKLLLEASHSRSRSGVIERFISEARAAASLHHPNVIDTLDADEHEGMPFIVLELLEGEPLSARMAREHRLSPEATTEIIAPLLDALQAVHAKGIVHRDIKPDNIFLAKIGGRVVPKLLDFGIAKLRDAAIATQTGSILGTPTYMSPEQARGAIREMGPATDLWALGVVMYECLTGSLPHDVGEGCSPLLLLAKIATETPPPLRTVLPGVAEALAQTVDGALQLDPKKRFATAGEMHAALLGQSRPEGLAPTIRLEASVPPASKELEALGMAQTMAAHAVAAHNIAAPAPTLTSGFPWLRVVIGIGAAGVLLVAITLAFVARMVAARAAEISLRPPTVSEAPIASLPPTPTVPVQAPTQAPVESAPVAHPVRAPATGVARPASRPATTTRVESPVEVPAADPPAAHPARPTHTETRTGRWNRDEL